MTFMDAGFILRTYLLSRTECHAVLYRTYGTVYLTARIFDRCVPCARTERKPKPERWQTTVDHLLLTAG